MEYGFYTNELNTSNLDPMPGSCKSQPIPRNLSSVENSKSGLYDPPPPRPSPSHTNNFHGHLRTFPFLPATPPLPPV